MAPSDTLDSIRYPIGKFEAPATFDTTQSAAWIAAIEAMPLWLDHLIENLDAGQLETPYRPGGWTMNQTIHHLADSHLNAFVRFKLTLTEEQPAVKPYAEALWAETPECLSLPANISITLLHALHRRWAALMRSMSETQWQRCFFHPEQQRLIPLWELGAQYAWHGRHHTEQLLGLRQRMAW